MPIIIKNNCLTPAHWDALASQQLGEVVGKMIAVVVDQAVVVLSEKPFPHTHKHLLKLVW